ncbi:hypothetical protein [Streptomonospora arabica]|uniref:TPR repeat domain-containing protein n=1 Tax=Streptomonospora arabica TaxID=412417 RepID=A0ABV9SP83_9ACTN
MGRPDQETATASHPLFDPPQAQTDVSALREGTNWLWDLTGRIVGRSGDMRSVVTGAAMEFSDLVTQDISDNGEYNDALWRKTCMNISFAAGVGDRWADDVIDYKADRARLVADFETALNAGNTVAGEPASTIAEDKRRANLVRQFEARAQTRLDELNETGRERKRMLQDGPEPAHVAKLVDAGVLGWAPYNILGPGENPPLPVSKAEAEAMAADMGTYLAGKEPDARYFAIVSTLSAISNKAVALQGLDRANPGGRLSRNNLRSSEIAFLKEFYAGIEDRSIRGMLFLPENAARQEDYGQGPEHVISGPARKETWSALANGLLVLSDEGLGGSYDDLPPSIRRFADGEPYPNHAPGATHSAEENARAWMREAEDFERLLGRADPRLQGGVEFSANLTTSAGHHLNAVGRQEHEWDDSLSSLLEVATRNEQANHAILTGEHDHPTFDRNANALKGLYTHEWEDDGAGVAGLTDWISEAANSDDAERRADAHEAALDLIRMTTHDPDFYDELTNTGLTVHQNGEEYTDASIGLMNPHIARSLADVAMSHSRDFSLPQPTPGDVYKIDSATETMGLPYLARMRFLEYAAADPHTATRLYHHLGMRENASINLLAAGEGDPNGLGPTNGVFRSLVDNAVRMEALDRTDDATAAKQAAADAERRMENSVFNAVRTAAYAGTGYLGLGASSFTAGATRVAAGFMAAGVGAHEFDSRVRQEAEAVATQFQESNGPGQDEELQAAYDGQTFKRKQFEFKTQLDTLNYLTQQKGSGLTVEDVREQAPEIVGDDGRIMTAPEISSASRVGTAQQNGQEGVSGTGVLTTRMERLLDQAGAKSRTADFYEEYARSYEDTSDQLGVNISLDDAEELRGKTAVGTEPED